MKKEHLRLLQDPFTNEDLTLEDYEIKDSEIIKGTLVSSSNKFKIINGIPRFTNDESYSNNFGWQWNKWAKIQFEEENIGKPMENHTYNMFNKITEFTSKKINNKIVLDIGCGSGRFTDLVCDMGGIPISLDNSSAIEVAKENLSKKNKNILFIQGDALNLPIKSNSVDYAFSIGALHHTPNPGRGVTEAHRVLKNQGEFSISVYSAGSNYTYPSVHLWRKIFRFLWPIFKHYPPLIYSNIFGRLNYFIGKIHIYLTYPVKLFFPTIVLNDVNWSVLDTFDSVTTSYQSGHTIPEVRSWYKKSGFKKIRMGSWRVNLIGIK